MTLPRTHSQEVHCPKGRQLPKQPRSIANEFTPVDFDSLQKCLLDAVPGIGMIAHQPANGAPYHAHVLVYNRIPIRHLRAPVKKNRGSMS